MLDIDPALARWALGTFLLERFFCLCLMFIMFLETDVCSVEVVNLDEDAIECMSSVSSYIEDSTSEDTIDDVSVAVVIAPTGFKPIVDADPPAPDGIGIPGPGNLGGRLPRLCAFKPSPRELPDTRAASSRLRRAELQVIED